MFLQNVFTVFCVSLHHLLCMNCYCAIFLYFIIWNARISWFSADGFSNLHFVSRGSWRKLQFIAGDSHIVGSVDIRYYLQNTLHITEEQTEKMLKNAPLLKKCASFERFKSRIELLEQYDFNKSEISTFFVKNPGILLFKLETNLIPKLIFLENSLALSKKEIHDILLRNGRLLSTSSTLLSDSIYYLRQALSCSASELGKIIHKFPLILAYSITTLHEIIDTLQYTYCFTQTEIFHAIRKNPYIFNQLTTKHSSFFMTFFTDLLGFPPPPDNKVLKKILLSWRSNALYNGPRMINSWLQKLRFYISTISDNFRLPIPLQLEMRRFVTNQARILCGYEYYFFVQRLYGHLYFLTHQPKYRLQTVEDLLAILPKQIQDATAYWQVIRDLSIANKNQPKTDVKHNPADTTISSSLADRSGDYFTKHILMEMFNENTYVGNNIDRSTETETPKVKSPMRAYLKSRKKNKKVNKDSSVTNMKESSNERNSGKSETFTDWEVDDRKYDDLFNVLLDYTDKQNKELQTTPDIVTLFSFANITTSATYSVANTSSSSAFAVTTNSSIYAYFHELRKQNGLPKHLERLLAYPPHTLLTSLPSIDRSRVVTEQRHMKQHDTVQRYQNKNFFPRHINLVINCPNNSIDEDYLPIKKEPSMNDSCDDILQETVHLYDALQRNPVYRIRVENRYSSYYADTSQSHQAMHEKNNFIADERAKLFFYDRLNHLCFPTTKAIKIIRLSPILCLREQTVSSLMGKLMIALGLYEEEIMYITSTQPR